MLAKSPVVRNRRPSMNYFSPLYLVLQGIVILLIQKDRLGQFLKAAFIILVFYFVFLLWSESFIRSCMANTSYDTRKTKIKSVTSDLEFPSLC
jgi:hypothetical protein